MMPFFFKLAYVRGNEFSIVASLFPNKAQTSFKVIHIPLRPSNLLGFFPNNLLESLSSIFNLTV
jgi:hypothetical protein